MKILLSSTPKILSVTPNRITRFDVYNPNAYAVYIKFYDSPVGATLGSSVPMYTTQVPAEGTLYIDPITTYKAFNLGIILAVSQSYLETDSTAIGISVVANVDLADSNSNIR